MKELIERIESNLDEILKRNKVAVLQLDKLKNDNAQLKQYLQKLKER